MRDIATRVGVSPATVSLVLSNHPSISKPTRDRVLRAQRELGYTVNRFAQQFVRNTRRRPERRKLDQLAFCLIGTTFDNVAYAPFLHGIVSESQDRHLHLITQALEVSADGAVVLSAAIRNGGADGIIVSGLVDDTVISFLQQFRAPLVVLGNHYLQSRVARVEIDIRRVGATVAEDLAERGHRNLAFVVEKLEFAYERECLEGVKSGLGARGLVLPQSHVICAGQSYAPSADLIAPFLKLDPLPTAIVTTDVRAADECVAELRARQIDLPAQVEVVTMTVSGQARRGVRYRRYNLGLERCGRLAVRRLVELVENPAMEPSVSILPPLGWVADDPHPTPSSARLVTA